MDEYVTLVVAGYRWRQWTRAAVTYSAKQAARAFAFSLTDAQPWLGAWNFMPGEECAVYGNGDLLCQGYINTMSPSYEAQQHKVEISGRSKSQDTIDCSAEHDKGEFKEKNPLQIAQALDKYGVGYKADTDLKNLSIFRLNPGETIHQAVERACRKQQLIMMGQPDGSVLITKGGEKRVHPPLIEGVNILGASATFGDEDKHSDYVVKGQRAFGSQSKTSLRVEAKATDNSVKRKRTKVILPETDVTEEEAQRRAENHRDKQQGESVKASVKLQGWRDAGGQIWQANTLIYVQSPMLKLSMDLLIESVSLTQDEGGTFTQLSLVQPQALGSSAKQGSRTDPVWKFDPAAHYKRDNT